VRTRFAADDYLTRYPADSAHRLRIDSPRAKPGWKERQPGDQIRADFPGSTIVFEDQHWEVIRMEAIVSRPPRFYYYLAPWDDSFPIRQRFRYDARECEAVRAHAIEEERGARLTLALTLASPLVGALPAPDQRRIETNHGVRADRATLLSAFICFVLSLTVAASSSSITMAVVGWYLGIESMARLYYSGKGGGVAGSAMVVIPLGLYRVWRRSRAIGSATAAADDIVDATDEVTVVTDGEHALEVLSLLPKPHWTDRTGIRHAGQLYAVASRSEVTLGGLRHHQFLLTLWLESDNLAGIVDYSPTEVRALHLAERRTAGGAWIDALVAIWGLLGESDQRRLERTYGHDPIAATTLSIVVTVLLGLVAAGTALVYLAGDAARVLDLVALTVGLALLIDALRRWQHLGDGRIVASVLKPLVEPLARRLL